MEAERSARALVSESLEKLMSIDTMHVVICISFVVVWAIIGQFTAVEPL
jgi:hypothetical protein